MTRFVAIGVGLLLFIQVAVALPLLAVMGAVEAAACQPTPSGAVVADGAVATVSGTKLDKDQWANARTIVTTGLARGIPQRGLVIAIAVAKAESDLVVLDSGDAAGPDSRGLFQQRGPWGPYKVRMDPAGSSRLFYNALKATKGWKTMEMGEVAYRVQRFDPSLKYRYSDNEAFATAVVTRAVAAVSTTDNETGEGAGIGAHSPAHGPAVQLAVMPTKKKESSVPATTPFGPDLAVAEKRVWPRPRATLGGGFGIKGALWSLGYHTGADFSGATGQKIYAAHDGTVTALGDGGAFGTSADISWNDPATGRWTNRYAHMSARYLKDGQKVLAGTVIGLVGATGNTTGPHLHFELIPGANASYENAIDPVPWLDTGALEPQDDADQADCDIAAEGVPGEPGAIIGVVPGIGPVSSPLSKPFRDGGHAYYLPFYKAGTHRCNWAGKCMDLFGKIGDPVHAFAEGTVMKETYSPSSYGHHIWVRHDDGSHTIYAHLTKTGVTVGQKVAPGQVIGTMGCSGTRGESNNCQDSEQHLHWEWSGMSWKSGTLGEDPPFWGAWPKTNDTRRQYTR